MDIGEKLQVIVDGQYDLFASSMAGRGVDPSLALLVLDAMRARLLETAYHKRLNEEAQTELQPGHEECHKGTVEDLKESLEHENNGEME